MVIADLKLPFGLKGEKLVHISQVDSGLKCDCVCPACSHPLVARKGNIVVHHFAHYNGAECEHATETALHIAAKDILNKHRKMKLPPAYLEFRSYKKPWVIYDEMYINFDDVKIENKFKDVIPDVIVYIKGQPLIIEVAVTHKTNEEKLNRIKQEGISVLEIVLEQYNRNFSFSELEDDIINHARSKRWLYNRKCENVKKALIRIGKKKSIIPRGLALHVDYCPIKARIWKGKPYANYIDDCINCQHFIDPDHNDGNLESIICVGHLKLSTYEDFINLGKTHNFA